MSSQQGCGPSRRSNASRFALCGRMSFVGEAPRQDGVQTTPNELGWRHHVQRCTLPAAIQQAGVMWNGGPNQVADSAFSHRAQFLLSGLLCRKILISDRVGRFDSPVKRRTGTMAGTFSKPNAEAGTARSWPEEMSSSRGLRRLRTRALPCGNVLCERSPIGRARRAAVARIW